MAIAGAMAIAVSVSACGTPEAKVVPAAEAETNPVSAAVEPETEAVSAVIESETKPAENDGAAASASEKSGFGTAGAGSFSGKIAAGAGKKAAQNQELSLDDRVVFDWEGLRVIAKYVNLSGSAPEVRLLVENDSPYDVAMHATDEYINDFSVGSDLYAEIPSGRKKNMSLTFHKDSIEDSFINTPRTLEFTLFFNDMQNRERLVTSEPVRISLSGSEDTPEEVPEGQVLIDQDGIRMIALGISSSTASQTTVVLYAENKSEHPIMIEQENTSVNGFMVNASMVCYLDAGRKSYGLLFLNGDSLRENEIQSIEEIQLDLAVKNTDDWTEPIPLVEDAVILFD